jgi:D-serine deaminase-like pyridoxal phosphate-dependent protein
MLLTGGVLWDGDEGIALAQRIANSPHLTFRGVYTHEGQSYHVKTVTEVKEIGEQVTERILTIANR